MKLLSLIAGLLLLLTPLWAVSTFEVTLDLSNSTRPLSDAGVNPSSFPLDAREAQGDFELAVVMNNQAVYSTFITAPRYIIYTDGASGSGSYASQPSRFRIRLPYFGPEQTIQIIKDGKALWSGSVEPLMCNHNGVCEASEDGYGCPSDCQASAPAVRMRTLQDMADAEELNLTPNGADAGNAGTGGSGGSPNPPPWPGSIAILCIGSAVIAGPAVLIFAVWKMRSPPPPSLPKSRGRAKSN